jgi:hypothetical protein
MDPDAAQRALQRAMMSRAIVGDVTWIANAQDRNSVVVE